MVAAEAAAAGALPVSANHSGAAEVSRALAERMPEDLRALVSFDLDDDAVRAIADRVGAWLALDPEERAAAARFAASDRGAALELARGRALGALGIGRRARLAAASSGRLSRTPLAASRRRNPVLAINRIARQ